MGNHGGVLTFAVRFRDALLNNPALVRYIAANSKIGDSNSFF